MIIFNFILFSIKGENIVIEKKSSLVLSRIMVIMHILLSSIGVALYCFLGKDSESGIAILVGLFILCKFLWLCYCSRGKKIIEKIANFLVMLSFGYMNLLILLNTLIETGKIVDSGKLISSNLSKFLFDILWAIMVTIAISRIEKRVMQQMDLEIILPSIISILLGYVFSLILIYIDTKDSAIVSAFVALFILMLTPENIEALFNVKVSKYREQQISLIKFHVTFLLPFIYILSKIFPLPIGDQFENTDIRSVVFRFLFLVIIWLIPMSMIYFKKSRQFFQTFFGLTSSQIELNGNWYKVVIDKSTGKNIPVMPIFLKIDGRRIRHKDTFFYFNEKYEVFNDEEKIGKIKRINSDEIILVFYSCEDNNSKLKNNKVINLIRIGSDKYNIFNLYY